MSLHVDRVRHLIDLGVPNWGASVVCALMIVLYLDRAECTGPDPDAAWIAVAWGVIFGVSLYSAAFKSRQRYRARTTPENASTGS